MRPDILSAAILQVLADHGQLATERYVALALAVAFNLKVSYSEIREALGKLEERKHVISVRRDDSELVWSASELGKSVLSELR